MSRDIRDTPAFRAVDEVFRRSLEPGLNGPTGAADLATSPDGTQIAFSATYLTELEGYPSSRIALVPSAGGDATVITNGGGPVGDRMPRWSPDGALIAFLSDRVEDRVSQPQLLATNRPGEARQGPAVDGVTEWLDWSPDGTRLLMLVAGRGAEQPSAAGSGRTADREEDLPDWMPTVDSGDVADDWRRLWVARPSDERATPLSREGLQIWEAWWLGDHAIAAIVSESPGEGSWYTAALARIDADSGKETILLRSDVQLALPRATPSGGRLAVVESLVSDRAVVAGALLLIDLEDGTTARVDTDGVDVSDLVWRDENRLVYSGLRGLRSVVAEFDVSTGRRTSLWDSDHTSGDWYPSVTPSGTDSALVVEHAYDVFPRIVEVAPDRPDRIVTDFDHAGARWLRERIGTSRPVEWTAPDGLNIEGLLLEPAGDGPHPLVVFVHGGPVWAYLNSWQGAGLAPQLVARGYAVLMPNSRGSTGHGADFVNLIRGDMGGDDVGDFLSGIDALVADGVVDTARVGVLGGSYGGFMSDWLVTRTDRFAAAVAISPVTHWTSQHFTSNIPHFDALFLDGDPFAGSGAYVDRSPLFHAQQVSTPVLQTAGDIDECTPQTEALQFHRALLAQGVESELVVYPGEGHGVRKLPAAADLVARTVAWFERHMPPSPGADVPSLRL